MSETCPYHCTCHKLSRLVAENSPSRPTVLLAWPYDLESAVRRGCESSREIWSIVLKAGQDTAGDEEEGNQPSKDWCDELWMRTDRERACGSLHVPSDPSCHFHRMEKVGQASTYTGSDSSFQIAQDWLRSCLVNHRRRCSTVGDSLTFVPTRLINVGKESDSPLILRERLDPPVRWACLSHCWGGFQPLKTTQETLGEHRRKIPWESLPKTFQEAVDFTRRLKLQYLWIDSLCILQEDDDDWQFEAARMVHIYQNATITLSATAAQGPHSGLYSHSFWDETVVYAIDHGSPVTLRSGGISHRPRELPLSNRGWAMQERLLSPRVLHFGAQELLWECMESYDCQCGGIDCGNPTSWFRPKSALHPDNLSTLSRDDLGHEWRDSVDEYVGMRLTKPTDVFPALSGIARLFASVIAQSGRVERYLAGIWEHSFIEDCLRETLWVQTQDLGTRSESYLAPTWSWASVSTIPGGTVRYWPPPNHEKHWLWYTQLVDFYCKTIGNDEMGQVVSAYATLKGPLRSVFLEDQSQIEWSLTRSSSSPRSSMAYNGNKNHIGWSVTWPGKSSETYACLTSDYNIDLAGPYQILPGSELFALALASREQHWVNNELWITRPEFSCLVLRKIIHKAEHQKPIYERIGLMRFLKDETPPDSPAELREDAVLDWPSATVTMV